MHLSLSSISSYWLWVLMPSVLPVRFLNLLSQDQSLGHQMGCLTLYVKAIEWETPSLVKLEVQLMLDGISRGL